MSGRTVKHTKNISHLVVPFFRYTYLCTIKWKWKWNYTIPAQRFVPTLLYIKFCGQKKKDGNAKYCPTCVHDMYTKFGGQEKEVGNTNTVSLVLMFMYINFCCKQSYNKSTQVYTYIHIQPSCYAHLLYTNWCKMTCDRSNNTLFHHKVLFLFSHPKHMQWHCTWLSLLQLPLLDHWASTWTYANGHLFFQAWSICVDLWFTLVENKHQSEWTGNINIPVVICVQLNRWKPWSWSHTPIHTYHWHTPFPALLTMFSGVQNDIHHMQSTE